ncbi:tetratricopeptide repeat protein [Micromonospora sp. NPDC005161]
MRWATVILGAVVAGAIGWWAAAGPNHQDSDVAVGVAAAIVTIVVTALTKWANRDGHPIPDPDQLAARDTGPLPPGAAGTDPPQMVIGDLPGQAVAWQDRVELLDRLTVMAGHGRTVVVCAVTGQRGIGKTQLAAAYARARVAEGWPVVVWVVADTPANLVTGLDALAAQAGVRQPDTDPVDAARAALAWLRAHSGPCLLVYDNAVDPDLIRAWTPPVGAVHTVVTTTRHDFGNLGEPVDVTLFTPTEAVTYLRARTGLTDDTGAGEVAEQLGWLPLALAQAGAVIGPRRRYRSYRAYLDRLATMSVTDMLPRPSGDPYPHGAAEAILLALDDLAANDPDGHARNLLDHLAVLAPTGVDPAMLAHLTDDDTAAVVLAERSLTIPTVDTDRTVVHRLVQRVVRDHNQHLGRLDTLLSDTVDRLDAAAQQTGEQWATRTLIADYVQHAQTLAAHPTDESTTRRLLTLRIWMQYWLGRVHSVSAALTHGAALVEDCERVLGPDHPETLESRNDLALAYQAVGRLDEAIDLYQRTLADRERVLGPDHPDTLASRNTLGGAYRLVGRLDESIDLVQRTLADRERVLGPDHRATLASRNDVANAYWMVGRLGEAIDLVQRTLADRERVLGSDHPETLASRNVLASSYQIMGRLDEAIDLQQRTLADRERILGSDHPDALVSRNDLALAYQAVGRLDEAVELCQRTLSDCERVLGPDHPHTLGSRNDLAYAYQAVGRLDEAIDLHQRTLADRERVLGPDHPDTLTSRNNLAGAYQTVGRLDEAIDLHQRTLADRERILGPDHPETLASRNNLAGACETVGRLDEAIDPHDQPAAQQ